MGFRARHGLATYEQSRHAALGLGAHRFRAFLQRVLDLARELEHVDLFVSKAAGEVLRQYKQKLDLPETARGFRREFAPGGLFLSWGLPYARRSTRNLEYRGQIRLRDFR